MKVVGVGQLDLTADLLKVLCIHGSLDGSLSTDIHEYRCLNGPVNGLKPAAPGGTNFF